MSDPLFEWMDELKGNPVQEAEWQLDQQQQADLQAVMQRKPLHEEIRELANDWHAREALNRGWQSSNKAQAAEALHALSDYVAGGDLPPPLVISELDKKKP